MQRNLFLLISLYCFLLWKVPILPVNPAFAQKLDEQIEVEKEVKIEQERQKFIKGMQILLDAALKSGFSEKEIREITVTRKGKMLHIWDLLEQEKLREKKEALARKSSLPRERYLTVMDIADELEGGETKDLDALKDKSIFVGAEEK